jgi:phage-related protein
MARKPAKPKPPKPVPARFWRTATGTEPVREWLKGLPKSDRKIIGDDLRVLQFGWPIGMPLCRPLGKGLAELRSTLSTHRIARILLTHFDGTLVLLHGFIKKDQKTPKSDLDLARQRLNDLKDDRKKG